MLGGAPVALLCVEILIRLKHVELAVSVTAAWRETGLCVNLIEILIY